MKSNFIKSLIVVALLGIQYVSAQAPNLMSYQAVVRNAANALVTNTGVGMKVSVLQGTATGTEVYKELFNPNPVTNVNGLVSVQIGSGLPITGTFGAIDWSAGPYFIKTETDPTGGTNYTIVSTSQLMSVPYALYAKTSGSTIVSFLASDANTSVPKSTTVAPIFNTIQESFGSNYNGTTGEYTIPVAGYYAISTNIDYEFRSNAACTSSSSLTINNSIAATNFTFTETPNSFLADNVIYCERWLAVGDKIKPLIRQTGDANNLAAGEQFNRFSVNLLHK